MNYWHQMVLVSWQSLNNVVLFYSFDSTSYGRPIRQAIILCSCGFYLLFFLAYFQRSQVGCLPYFYTWCGLSANLEYRSEMCYMCLAENTGRKNSPSAHHCTVLLGYILSTKAYIENQKKIVKHQYISSTCPHNMVNFSPLAAEINWWVWGTPANFNVFRVLASLLHRRHWTEVSQTLHDVWPSIGPGLVHYTYIFGGSCPLTEFCQVGYKIHFISKSCVLLYWQRYCTALEKWASAKLYGVVSSRDRAAVPFDSGWLNCLVAV